MEPKFPEGTIITVSPKHPPRNGQHVAARLNGEGVFFKIFHHSGDNKTVTLTSYNPAFPPMVYNRERFDWIYPVTDATQKLL